MKRFAMWTPLFILFYALLCMPILSEALTVTVSKVDPTWIPEASTSTNLSIAWVNVTISGIDKRKDQYKRIEVTLDASKEPGICCNAEANYGTIKDLVFTKQENEGVWEVVDNARLRYEIKSDSENIPDTLVLPVGVRSLDYGGYGTVSVGVRKRQKGFTDRYETDTSVESVSSDIPKDDIGKNNQGNPGNNIADAWEYDHANLTAGEDNDTSFGSQNQGDNLTAYEEYRGFMTDSTRPPSSPSVSHTRTSPSTKDMFVVNEDAHTSSYGTGTGPSHISLHLVPSTHVNADGRVNFKGNKGLLAYSAKIVSSDTFTTGEKVTVGEAPIGPPGPGEARVAIIYTTQIKRSIARGDVGKAMRDTVGHELAHLAHLDHCPKSDVKDANGNDKGWATKCLMWPDYVSSQSEFASHHDPDYALAAPLGPPQEAVVLGPQGNPKPRTAALSRASTSSNTATAGDSHTANFTAPSPYTSVYWYVKSPTDTSAYGTTIEIDQGNGTLTTADFTYTFPSGVSGNYLITAYTYMSDNTIAEPSYTVSVSLTAPQPTPTPPATPPSVSLVPDSDSVALGETIGATLTLGAAPSYVFWYVQQPWELSPGTLLSQDTSGSLTSLFGHSTSGWNSGTCTINVSGTWASDGSAFTQSTWITLSQ